MKIKLEDSRLLLMIVSCNNSGFHTELMYSLNQQWCLTKYGDISLKIILF